MPCDRGNEGRRRGGGTSGRRRSDRGAGAPDPPLPRRAPDLGGRHRAEAPGPGRAADGHGRCGPGGVHPPTLRHGQPRVPAHAQPGPGGPGRVGPCSVESPEQLMETAQAVRQAGAVLLRGGAFKPRTSPYAFQGLAEDGLKLLAQARAATGLPVVTEVVAPGDVELVASYADML